VEDGRPNVVGLMEGAGGAKSLMFNGHMDTSYSGQEPWLAGIRGFQPQGFVQDGRVYGLGISNMKGALACYMEAVRALRAAGVRLRGDVMIACVSGEIEKTQWHPDYVGREYRGYASGSRFLASHGGVADMCILGEPTEQRIVLGHYGSIWMRISTRGPFVHTAFSAGRRDETSIARMRDVLDAVLAFAPEWEERTSYGGKPGIVNIGAINGGFAWRVSRTPHRTDLFVDFRVPPTMPMTEARAALGEFVRGLRDRFPDHGIESEIYVTAPGSEIAGDHPLVQAIDAAHEEVFGAKPERDTVRWFSDASALTRYGIQSVNYGTSSGLPDAELGENLDIDGLVRMADVYARVAQRICEVA
jgi:acetylornithine deacetylase